MEPSLSGKTRILAACETSFNHRMAPALMDHVFPDKTQCESIFYLILNLLSTLVCKENHIAWDRWAAYALPQDNCLINWSE